jgi:hypothetical protein
MSFINDLKNNNAKIRLNEEKIYAEVMREMKSNILRDGLWAKAMSEVNFDEKKAKAKYIKLRVQSIIDEITIHNENLNRKLEQETIEANKRKIKNAKKQLSTVGISIFKFFLWIVLSSIFTIISWGIYSVTGTGTGVEENYTYIYSVLILSIILSFCLVYVNWTKLSSKDTKIVKRK